jgi:hypothetical protein
MAFPIGEASSVEELEPQPANTSARGEIAASTRRAGASGGDRLVQASLTARVVREVQPARERQVPACVRDWATTGARLC